MRLHRSPDRAPDPSHRPGRRRAGVAVLLGCGLVGSVVTALWTGPGGASAAGGPIGTVAALPAGERDSRPGQPALR